MSTRILILKDGVITPSRSSGDISNIVTSLGLTKSSVGLPLVDNTSDLSKPISTATQTALNLKANLASPALTGTPTTPTATAGTNNTQIANTAFVSTAISDLVASSPAALDTLNELATALGNDANFATTINTALSNRVDVSSNQSNIQGLKTFTTGIRVGGAIGNVRLTPGGASNAGYLEVFAGNSTTRLGFIGFDNTNLNYQSEGSAVHSFTGNRVDVFGGTVPPTSTSRISLFLNSTNAYFALISSSAPTNYKAYDFCNESGNFSIRRINNGYEGISGNVLRYFTNNVLLMGDSNTRSDTTYGSFSASGSVNGYAGIHFPQSSDGQILMLGTTSRHCGVWSPSCGWHWLYNAGNLSIYSSDVATQGSFIGLFKGLNSLPGYPSDRYPTVCTDFSALYISVGGAYTGHFTSAGYTNVSDKNKKRVINDINPLETLHKISNLPVTRFHYRDEDPRMTHIGTFAQDFWRAFECGGNQEIIDDDSPISPDKMLAVTDVAGVCLSGIQGLKIKIDLLEEEIKDLNQKIDIYIYANSTTN